MAVPVVDLANDHDQSWLQQITASFKISEDFQQTFKPRTLSQRR
ncbi:hypothetical protein [Rheinheimera riviphila]|nr:hypothetical protein [Rheinheimera riviphila]